MNRVVKMMDAQEKYEHWLDVAKYDLDTADAMFNTGRWLYVAFMCQQAVEKLCKGLFVLHVSDEVPRVHNIRNVVSRFSGKLSVPITDEQYHLFDTLTGFYIDGRYPEYKQKLSALLDEKECKELIVRTKEVFEWLQTLKP
jgi:HEPN domain-containing protein